MAEAAAAREAAAREAATATPDSRVADGHSKLIDPGVSLCVFKVEWGVGVGVCIDVSMVECASAHCALQLYNKHEHE